jgi:ABC-type nickel/cobalt efflux system permease component RcnA
MTETKDTWLLPSGDVAFVLVPSAGESQVDSLIGFAYVDTLVSPTIIPPEPLQPDGNGVIPILRSKTSQPTADQQVSALQPRAIQSFPGLPPSEAPTPTPGPKTSMTQGGEREFGELIHHKQLSPLWVMFALVLAMFYGAGHALTPGHGKTIVAAYLVGSRGTVWHAIYLGLIVTLTHMGSVFIVGLVALQLESSLLQGNLIPVMEGISGLIIIGMGLYLFLSRYRNLVRVNTLVSLGVDDASSYHEHSHTHDDNHHHDHFHTHEIPAGAGLWDLLVLGISGGMVPCPTAIVVLMVAIGLGRTAFGLLLIAAFSVGLATVLIIVGILMVTAKHLLERFTYSGHAIRVLPVFSGVLITCIGMWLTVYALIRAGILVVNL